MRKLALLGIVILGGLMAGCNREDAVVEPVVVVDQKPAAVVTLPPVLKSFREVAHSDVPDGEQRPPDVTVAGKNVGKLYEQVAVLFDQIKFVDNRGRAITYFATVKTDQGDIRIELLGDSAPNHVRNFIALARAGYYTGLPFHRTVRQKINNRPDEAYLETGCPLGTGELGYGSIGYWLKAEPSEELIHDDGIVGATHTLYPRGNDLEDLDNAACKFYIALSKAAWRDRSFTIFGKVVQGLGTAHTINQRPTRMDRGYEDAPEQPVVIRDVIIDEVVAGGSQIARGDN